MEIEGDNQERKKTVRLSHGLCELCADHEDGGGETVAVRGAAWGDRIPNRKEEI